MEQELVNQQVVEQQQEQVVEEDQVEEQMYDEQAPNQFGVFNFSHGLQPLPQTFGLSLPPASLETRPFQFTATQNPLFQSMVSFPQVGAQQEGGALMAPAFPTTNSFVGASQFVFYPEYNTDSTEEVTSDKVAPRTRDAALKAKKKESGIFACCFSWLFY